MPILHHPTVHNTAMPILHHPTVHNTAMPILRHRRFYLYALLAGFVFRLFFIVHFPVTTDDDTVFYAEIAKTWVDHGTYGQMEDGVPKPTYTRLPGYPAFLAAVFFVFGDGQYLPVLLIQTLFDLGSCLLITALARAMFGEGAALTALWASILSRLISFPPGTEMFQFSGSAPYGLYIHP